MDFITDFFINNFQNCIWLAIILVAICPTLESKIAIPLAMNASIWGSSAFSPFMAFLISFLGSIIPCYLILIMARKIKNKTSGFVVDKIFKKYLYKSQTIEKQQSKLKKYLVLTAFVAVPIPLTGVWTGSLIAGLSNLNIHYSFLSITIGAMISAAVISILCSLFENSIAYIFMFSLLIIIIFMTVDLCLSLFNFKRNKNI